MRGSGIPLQTSRVDTLQNTGEAEHREREIEMPLRNQAAARASAIRGHISGFIWHTAAIGIARFDAAERLRRKVIRQAVIRKIGEWMAKRRKFPIDNRDNARLSRMEDEIFDPIVAVHDGDLVTGWNVLGQPRHQTVHRRNLVGLGRDVLLAPAPDLTSVIIPRL